LPIPIQVKFVLVVGRKYFRLWFHHVYLAEQ